jgi:MoaA/NifB/PqqE/SkfB family radical SAM enzyme
MLKMPLYDRLNKLNRKVISLKNSLYNHYRIRDPEAVHRKSIFSDLPSLARLDRLAKITHKGYSRPLALKVEPVNFCNNDCIICPCSLQTRKRQTMSMELFEKVVSDYKELGGGILSIAVLVGDIFLDKNLTRRIEVVKKNKHITRLTTTTNGVLADQFDRDSLKYIVRSFDRFRISVYGLDAEEHKILTRRDDYERAVESYTRILSCSKGNVKFEIRLLKNRTHSEVYKWLEDLKKKSNYNGIFKVGGIINEYYNWSVFDVNSKLPFDARWAPMGVNAETCIIPLTAPAVTANGDFSFCGCANFDLSKELLLGNVNNSSLKDLYNSDLCRRLYSFEKFGVPEFCKTCTFYVPVSALENQPIYFSDELYE